MIKKILPIIGLSLLSSSIFFFSQMIDEVGKLRVYAGIHYTYSCVEARKQGERIAQNIISMLKFLKDE